MNVHHHCVHRQWIDCLTRRLTQEDVLLEASLNIPEWKVWIQFDGRLSVASVDTLTSSYLCAPSRRESKEILWTFVHVDTLVTLCNDRSTPTGCVLFQVVCTFPIRPESCCPAADRSDDCVHIRQRRRRAVGSPPVTAEDTLTLSQLEQEPTISDDHCVLLISHTTMWPLLCLDPKGKHLIWIKSEHVGFTLGPVIFKWFTRPHIPPLLERRMLHPHLLELSFLGSHWISGWPYFIDIPSSSWFMCSFESSVFCKRNGGRIYVEILFYIFFFWM